MIDLCERCGRMTPKCRCDAMAWLRARHERWSQRWAVRMSYRTLRATFPLWPACAVVAVMRLGVVSIERYGDGKRDVQYRVILADGSERWLRLT